MPTATLSPNFTPFEIVTREIYHSSGLLSVARDRGIEAHGSSLPQYDIMANVYGVVDENI